MPRTIPFAPTSIMPELYSAYMPFVRGGGLFIPTEQAFTLGESCLLILKLPDTDEMSIVTQVVWTMVPQPQSGKAGFRGGTWKQGVGLRLTGQEGTQAKLLIEKMLGRHLSSTQPTYTF